MFVIFRFEDQRRERKSRIEESADEFAVCAISESAVSITACGAAGAKLFSIIIRRAILVNSLVVSLFICLYNENSESK